MKTSSLLSLAAVLLCSNVLAQNSLTQAKLEKVWETGPSMTTAESVLYNRGNKTIYVSNINGDASMKDGNGFISTLSTAGSIKKLKWATGLNAPKGMAINDGKLYVSDIDELVELDLSTGKLLNRYPIENAEFLNDVAADGKRVLVSDSKTGTIHALENGKVKLLADNQKGINGLAFNKEGRLFSLDHKGLIRHSADATNHEVINGTVTGGDGLIILDSDTFIASRWQGEIYLIQNGKEKLLLDTKSDKSNTADIDFIFAEKLLLVPTFLKDKVAAYRLTY